MPFIRNTSCTLNSQYLSLRITFTRKERRSLNIYKWNNDMVHVFIHVAIKIVT